MSITLELETTCIQGSDYPRQEQGDFLIDVRIVPSLDMQYTLNKYWLRSVICIKFVRTFSGSRQTHVEICTKVPDVIAPRLWH